MTRRLALLLALSLAACGGPDLKSVTNKKLMVLGDLASDGGASYKLSLQSDGCPNFDESTQVQLDGQPMKRVGGGSRAVFDENKCDPAQWDFDGPEPKGDLHFTMQDGSDQLSMAVHDPSDVPQVRAAGDTLTRGQPLATDPAQPPEGFTGFALLAADGSTTQLDASTVGPVPTSVPAGPAQLVPEYQITPPVQVQGDTAGSAVVNVLLPPIPVTVQ